MRTAHERKSKQCQVLRVILLSCTILSIWSYIRHYITHAQQFAEIIKEQIQACPTVPRRDVSKLLLKYFLGSFDHDLESYTLFSVLQPGTRSYQLTLNHVTRGRGSYSYRALLPIAKLEHTNSTQRERRSSQQDIFSGIVYKLIKMGLKDIIFWINMTKKMMSP